MTTDALTLSRQVAWEMEGVRRARERFREAMAKSDPMDLPTGQRILRQCVPPLAEAIRAAQGEAQAAITSGCGGRPPLWHWPIQLLDAERMALVTLAVGAREGVNPGIRSSQGNGACITQQAEDLARRVRDEVEYDRWVWQQEAANKEAKARQKGATKGRLKERLTANPAADPKRTEREVASEVAREDGHIDLLARLKKTYPQVDRRTWAKWRVKVDALREPEWPKDVSVALGACLFRLLINACPTRFRLDEKPCSGGVQYFLQLTDEAKEELRDIEARAEVARPRLMPMIMPPIPWKYEEAA